MTAVKDRPVILISSLYEEVYVQRLREQFPEVNFVHLVKGEPLPDEVSEATAMLFGGMPKPELSALLHRAPNIRWIHTGSAGFDWVTVPELQEFGITISRSAGVMSLPMAEFAFAAMLAHAKNLFVLKESQERCAWEPPMHSELIDKTVLIVGAGAIGQQIAVRAKAFSMKVVGVKRTPESIANFDEVHSQEELDRLLPQADYVILTMPLTPETEGMFDRRRFELMSSHAYFINLARGALIVDEDFIDVMKEGLIAGATLDAYRIEPLPADSPLWSLPGVFISPHASYRSPRLRERVFTEFADNLRRYLAGEELANRMRHPELGY